MRTGPRAVAGAMELGITTFAETVTDPATGTTRGHGERLRQVLEEVEVAEQAGLAVYGVGEHHRADFAASAPAVVLAAAAARTDRIRLTSAVTVLSLRRPRAGLPGLRHPRPAVLRPRRGHRRPRLVRRVVPAVRLRPGPLRRAVRREARPAARAARLRARHLVRPASAPPCTTRPSTPGRSRTPCRCGSASAATRSRCCGPDAWACPWRWPSSAGSRPASPRSPTCTAARSPATATRRSRWPCTRTATSPRRPSRRSASSTRPTPRP